MSGVYLDLARKNLAGYDVRFLKGEVDKMQLPAASFDRVICTEVLEHVVDPEAVLGAIARLLRPTGVAIVTVPNDPLISNVKNAIRRTPLRRVLGDRIEWGGDTFHLHHWAPSKFERLLARYFDVLRRRAAPARPLPLRVCFRCGRRSEPR